MLDFKTCFELKWRATRTILDLEADACMPQERHYSCICLHVHDIFISLYCVLFSCTCSSNSMHLEILEALSQMIFGARYYSDLQDHVLIFR